MPGSEGGFPGGRTRYASAVLLALVAACNTDRPRAGMCDVEHLEVMWPARIERAGVTTNERLETTVTPTNVTPEVYDSLAATLVRGRPVAPAIVWSVPAFNTDPGGIAVAHPGRLTDGVVLRVAGVWDGGGWGVVSGVSADSALVGIEAGEFVSHSASGTLTVLETEPLALRLDVTAADSAGDTIRVSGDARFAARRDRRRCESFAAKHSEGLAASESRP